MIEQEIVKAGLLGTDKYMPAAIPALDGIQQRIAAEQTGKEDQFLKLAAVALLYREAGHIPPEIATVTPVSPDEQQLQVGEKMAALLEQTLNNKEEVLFRYLVHHMNRKQQVAPPELVPRLLDKALAKRSTAVPLVRICGVTGQWLCSLNEAWKGLLEETVITEGVWESGSLESRKQHLVALRQQDPQAALSLLETSIAEENAAGRLALAEVLQDNLSLHDEPFLSSLLKDKSQKVKELAMSLLQIIPGSEINRTYLDHVLKVLLVKEERHMLVRKRKVLVIDETVTAPEALFKTGIDKVSGVKGSKDSLYVLGQLIACIDPAVLAQALQCEAQELIGLLLSHAEAAALQPYLAEAAIRFHNAAWAQALLDNKQNDIRLLDTLPEAVRPGYYGQFLEDRHLTALLGYILDEQYTPVASDLAAPLLQQLRRSPYQVQQPDYQRLALHLPEAVTAQLKQYLDDPGEDYQVRYFKAQAMEMLRMMDFKKMIQ